METSSNPRHALALSLRATGGSVAISRSLHYEIAEPALSSVEGVAALPRNDVCASVGVR